MGSLCYQMSSDPTDPSWVASPPQRLKTVYPKIMRTFQCELGGSSLRCVQVLLRLVAAEAGLGSDCGREHGCLTEVDLGSLG